MSLSRLCPKGFWVLIGICLSAVAFTAADLSTIGDATNLAVETDDSNTAYIPASNLPRLPSDDEPTARSAQDYYLTYDDKEMFVKYAEYSETEVFVVADGDDSADADYKVTHWEVVESQAPPGLDAYLPKVEDDDGRTMYFAGTPMFVGRWCFNLRADIVVKQATPHNSDSSDTPTAEPVQLTQKLCFESARNEHDDTYKYLMIDKDFDHAVVGKDYYNGIYYSTDDPVAVEILWDNLPSTMTASNRYKEYAAVVVDGKPDAAGRYYINLKTYQEPDRTGEKPIATIYQQIPLHVFEQEQQQQEEGQPTYYCPEGYHYSETAGHCVQEKGIVCGDGTYYDATKEKCVSYQQRTYCPIGRYYDSWTGLCVRGGDPRCPFNYRYSWSKGRCVLADLWCPWGTTRAYHYFWGSYCKSTDCPRGYRYSYSRDRCVLKEKPCRPGYVWDYGNRQCRRSQRHCARGYHWSHTRETCIRNENISCGRGERYDYRRGHCVSSSYSRRCPVGQHWSSRHNGCVNNRDRRTPRRTVRPTRTSTPRRTVRPTRTSTPRRTVRPTRTSTPRRTVRPTRTSTPRRTVRPTRTSTPRRTVQPTRTSTPRRTVRPTRTSTPRRTVRPTRTSTPRRTVRPTRTSTPRRTVQPTRTSTPRRTVRPTRTSTPRRTVRPTRTSTPRRTVRPTRTSTPRRTVRPTRTSTPRRTVRPTRTSTPRRTVRPTRTSTPRRTVRPTRTSTPRRTVQPSRTSTPRRTVRPTRTSRPRPAPTRSGSAG